MDEAIYEELIDPAKVVMTSRMTSGYRKKPHTDPRHSASRRPTSSPDSGVFTQDRENHIHKSKPNTTSGIFQTRDNVRSSKVRFADEIVDVKRSCSENNVNSGDYVLMTGNGVQCLDGETTESDQQYVEMTPPKDWPKKKANDSKKVYRPTSSMLKGKAILRLAVYINSGMITVHLMHARHLQSKPNSLCNAFVKVSLVPDDLHLPSCCTEVISDTNHPVFDEKFSFELLPEDFQKRLYISVWNTSAIHSDAEFLGGTSYGIWHIYTQKRTVDGWYYLLHEEIGRRKHVQAIARQPCKASQTRKGQKVNDEGNYPDDHYAVIGNPTPPCLKGSTETSRVDRVPHSVSFREPLETSTPYKTFHTPRALTDTRKTSRVSNNSHSVEGTIDKHGNHALTSYSSLTGRGALEQIESVTRGIASDLLRQKEHVSYSFTSFTNEMDQNIGYHRSKYHHIDERRAKSQLPESRDTTKSMTSTGIIGQAIRQCVTKAVTTRSASSSQRLSRSKANVPSGRSVTNISRLDSSVSSLELQDSTLCRSTVSLHTSLMTSKDADSNNNDTLTADGGDSIKYDVSTHERLSKEASYTQLDNSEKSYIRALSKACQSYVFNFGTKTPVASAPKPKFAAIRRLNGRMAPPVLEPGVCQYTSKVYRSSSCVEPRIYENVPSKRPVTQTTRARSLSKTSSCFVDNKENMNAQKDEKHSCVRKSFNFGQKRKYNFSNISTASQSSYTLGGYGFASESAKRRKILKSTVTLTTKQTESVSNLEPEGKFHRASTKSKTCTVSGLRASIRASFRKAHKSRLSASQHTDGLIKMPGDTQTDDVINKSAAGFVDKLKGLTFAIPLSFSFRTKKQK